MTMFARILQKKEYLVIGIIVILFVCVSGLSLISINQLQGTGRVINYTGIVRGATQRLIKKEIHGNPDDKLIARLNSIVRELRHGGAENDLVALHDDLFQEKMARISTQWSELKNEIQRVRSGANDQRLYDLSETYFDLVDSTVFAAEAYSEKQVSLSKTLLMGANAIFVLFMAAALLNFLYSAALRRRAALLDRVAYVDGLTQMPNRASCDRLIEKYMSEPLKGNLSVLMFDMNNLKMVNDLRGHQGGDRLIAEFGKLLNSECGDCGFVGRYGGDEFLGIFRDADQLAVERYLAGLNMKVVSWNVRQVDDIDKISFAVGYCVGNEGDNDLIRLIGEADRRMYEKKRQMKENKN